MDPVQVTRTRVVAPPTELTPVRIPDILAYLSTCVPASSASSLVVLDRLMGAAMELAFRDAKRRLRDEITPFSGTPEGIGAADALVQKGSIDRVEREALEDVVSLFLALGYRPLEAATWEAASEEDFILTLPVTVDWGALDETMLSSFWKRTDPRLYARLPEAARDRILILHRGLDVSTLQGAYLDVKLDALGSFLVIRPLLQALACILKTVRLQDLAVRVAQAAPSELRVKRRARDGGRQGGGGAARGRSLWARLAGGAGAGALRCPASGKLATPGGGGCPFARFAARKEHETKAEGADPEGAGRRAVEGAGAEGAGGRAVEGAAGGPEGAAPAVAPLVEGRLPSDSPLGLFTLIEGERKKEASSESSAAAAAAASSESSAAAAAAASSESSAAAAAAASSESSAAAAAAASSESSAAAAAAASSESSAAAAAAASPEAAAVGATSAAKVPAPATSPDAAASDPAPGVPASSAGGETTVPVTSQAPAGLSRSPPVEVERRTFTRVLRNARATLSLLFRPLQLQDAAFRDVVVLYRRSRAPAGTLGTASPTRLEAIRRQLHLRRFARVPIADLELVFPDKHISIPPVVWIQLGVTVLAAVAAVLMTLRSGPDGDGDKASSSSMNTLYAAAALLFSRAFQVYSTVSFRRTWIQTQLGALLYDHSVASQDAVVVSALDELGVQHSRQVLLTYGVLAANARAERGGGAAPLSQDDLEVRVETLLRNEWSANVRFDATRALQTLTAWGVVVASEGTGAEAAYAAEAPERAAEKLRALLDQATAGEADAKNAASAGVSERDLVAGIASVLPERK